MAKSGFPDNFVCALCLPYPFMLSPMPKLLLNLRNVPDDEADDVRAMLDAGRIEFYETTASMWGISAGGIWVSEDTAFADAKRLMAEYQLQRGVRAREAHAAAKQAGTAETFGMVLRAEPGRVALLVLAVIFVLGLMALPAILLRG